MNSLYKLHTYSVLLAIIISFWILNPSDLSAQHSGIYFSDNSPNVNIEKRVNHEDHMVIITTKEGSVELLLTDDHIIVQFSQDGLANITDEINSTEVEHEEFSLIFDVFKSMLSSGLRTLLDHSLQISISELEEVIYRDSRLEMRTHNNTILFDNVEIGDRYIIEDFVEEDAIRFMAELEKRMKK